MEPLRDRPYHHGDLRAALLRAAEDEIAAHGVEGFSLRAVARRAGVSHAAPAHHFGDADGLLTALAADGFRRFVAAQEAREAQAAPDPRSRLLATGLGYIDFALARPALFRLIFGSDRPRHDDAELNAASRSAYDYLIDRTAAAGGDATDAAAVWAMTHGLADLIGAGRMKVVGNLPPGERERVLLALMARALPTSPGPA
jgi:AcrR family transcriptional regulator